MDHARRSTAVMARCRLTRLVLLVALAPSVSTAAQRAMLLPPDESVGVRSLAAEAATAGDPLPRIECDDGRVATVYATGLAAPDGLAASPIDGSIHVAEEGSGRVLRLAADGTATAVVEGLAAPEGIAFDPDGNLYIVEDVAAGRVLQVQPDGTVVVLADGRDAPEGVVFATDGHLYITESNVELVANPLQYRTRVSRVRLDGTVEVILSLDLFWSYAGITEGIDRFLYVTNEASGVGTNASVVRIDPRSGARSGTLRGLVSPEGLRFVPSGGLPLYVAQEDVGNGEGQTARVEPGLVVQVHCTGFSTIEDVLTTSAGSIFVSEDGTGLVIELAYP